MAEGAIKLAYLLRLGNCAICGKRQLETSLPLFYCVTISRMAFDADAVRRAAGREMAFGAVGHVLGPDEDLAKTLDGPHEVFVHEACAADIGHLRQLFPESAS